MEVRVIPREFLAISRLPFLGNRRMQLFVHLSIIIWLYTTLQYQSSRSSNFLVFHASDGISSRPTAFLFLIFVSTTWGSSCIICRSLISSLLLIIFVIGLSVTLGVFQANSWNVISTSVFIILSWQLLVYLPFTHIIYCLPCYSILSIVYRISNLIDLVLNVFHLFF